MRGVNGEEQELGFRDVKFEISTWYLSLIFMEEDYLGTLWYIGIFETVKLDEITMIGIKREQRVPGTELNFTPMFGDRRWGEI